MDKCKYKNLLRDSAKLISNSQYTNQNTAYLPLDVYTCYADYGIGVIKKRPNRNLLDYPIKDYSNLKFDDYFHNHKNLMNIIEYEKLMEII